jgi:hypothetical protein
MNGWTIGALGVVALALTGCETLNGPQAVANAEAQRDECKVVALTSGTQIMRAENQRELGRDDIRQAEGSLELGRLKLNEPKALRRPGAPNESIVSRMMRAC